MRKCRKNTEMVFWLWSCPFGSLRNTWSVKFMFAGVPRKWVPTKTLLLAANRSIVSTIAWDSEALLDGVKPMLDQYGCSLKKGGGVIAGDWRAGFDAWSGDWKERTLSHHFEKRNYGSTLCCDACLAVNPFTKTPAAWLPFLYTDFRLNAPWTNTIVTHEETRSPRSPRLSELLYGSSFVLLRRVGWPLGIITEPCKNLPRAPRESKGCIYTPCFLCTDSCKGFRM